MTGLLWLVNWKCSVAFHQGEFLGKEEFSFDHVELKCLQDTQVEIKVGNCIPESRIGH